LSAVGITAGASTPDYVIDEVEARIASSPAPVPQPSRPRSEPSRDDRAVFRSPGRDSRGPAAARRPSAQDHRPGRGLDPRVQEAAARARSEGVCEPLLVVEGTAAGDPGLPALVDHLTQRLGRAA
jgi:hypothetical protein